MIRKPLAVAFLALAGLSGCGSDEDIPLVKVTGTITKNAKPLPDVKVVFSPMEGSKFTTIGSDTTGPDGNYMLKFEGQTGVAPGKYKVSVEPAATLLGGGNSPDAFKDDPTMFESITREKKAVQAERRSASGNRAAAQSKTEAFKAEFDAEVKSGVEKQVLDFDIKVSSLKTAATAKN